MLFARGENAKRIQRFLGHHRASFTLDTYVHLLDDELPEAIDFGATSGATMGQPMGQRDRQRQAETS